MLEWYSTTIVTSCNNIMLLLYYTLDTVLGTAISLSTWVKLKCFSSLLMSVAFPSTTNIFTHLWLCTPVQACYLGSMLYVYLPESKDAQLSKEFQVAIGQDKQVGRVRRPPTRLHAYWHAMPCTLEYAYCYFYIHTIDYNMYVFMCSCVFK